MSILFAVASTAFLVLQSALAAHLIPLSSYTLSGLFASGVIAILAGFIQTQRGAS